MKISTIAITGGTHGNEMSGIYAIKNWLTYSPSFSSLPSLSCQFHFINQRAIEQCVRFIDEDLNRQFTLKKLANNKHSPSNIHEVNLAQQLNERLGPKGNSNTDLVIDIHNTTSEMGPTLIVLENDEFNCLMARYVKAKMPSANILLECEKEFLAHPYVCTLGTKGVMVEVGAQPQGALRHDILMETIELVSMIVQFAHAWNTQSLPKLPEAETFRYIEDIQYPLNTEGERLAVIHPNLQDNDFKPLHFNDPIFVQFNGKVVTWNEKTTVYPHFINEAAYAKSHLAFATAEKFLW